MQHVPNTPSIPPQIWTLAEDFFQQFGLSELDLPTKLAMVEDLYPQYLQRSASLTDTPLWMPYNEMQSRVVASMAFETFCGGKARTGKTDVLLGLAFTDHENSIIFRTEYSQMEALEERSRELLRGTGASYNASPSSKRWRDIPGDKTLKFGAIKHDKDIDKYFGRPHDFVGFDEIGKFKESHYLSLWGWICSVAEDQRVRVVCTGNPPGNSDERWIKRRWAAWVDDTHPKPAKPGELRWYVNLDGEDTEVEGPDAVIQDSKGKTLKPLSRTYIPGELLDFYKGTDYEAALDALPEPLRSQLRDGDFSIIEDDQALQVIPAEWIRLANARWQEMESPKDKPLRAVGVDVARGGRDQTVISKRWANWFDTLIKYDAKQTQTGQEVAAAIMEHVDDDDKDALIVIDLSGVGGSPYDILTEHEFSVDGFVSAAKSSFTDASGRLEFANRRAEAWWKFREALDPDSGEDLALPADPELMADLTAPTWKLGTRGIQIESKDDLKKRLGRSPDCGDAIVMNYNADVRSIARVSYF